MQIRHFALDPPLLLAPMEGVTDLTFRRLVRRIGGVSMTCTEFIPAAGLAQNIQRCRDMAIFDEDEPKELIGQLLPDVLVKGEDWAHYVSGREIVEQNGGRVVLASFVPGRSTTRIINKLAEQERRP